jgi:hypothetical protein
MWPCRVFRKSWKVRTNRIHSAECLARESVTCYSFKMRCRYVFEVQSLLKFDPKIPVDEAGMRFRFHVNEQRLLSQLSVEVSVPDENDWPSLNRANLRESVAHLTFTYPRYEDIRKRVRFLESAMGLYGVEQINLEEPAVEWTPESPEEQARLPVQGYKRQRMPPDLNGMPVVTLSLIAQSLFAYEEALHLEPGLSFVRRALVAIREERFIDAIYNAYFYLESTLGNGKTKTRAIATQFRRSEPLRREIEDAVSAFDVSQHPHRTAIEERFQKTYKGKSTDEIVDTIVSTRGFLHHHNRDRPGMWHPSEKWEYAADAFLLTSIVHRLAIFESSAYVFSQENKNRFARLVDESSG